MSSLPTTPDVPADVPVERAADAAPAISAIIWRPALIVFVSNFCVMVLELVAGRMIAPYVGVSLYTWTSVIGVVLAGISLGNYLGGWLADRWASLRLLGAIFLLGGLASLGILAFERVGNTLPNWGVVPQILVLTTALFFVPSAILGGVSPVVAKLAIHDLNRTGRTLGRIYASGTVGSIVGTFATGFILIAQFGTHAIVWGVAVILLAMGVLFLVAGNRGLGASSAVLLLVGLVAVGALGAYSVSRGALASVCTRETNYFCIKVRENEHGGRQVRVLILDRLVHSYSDLTDPSNLVYEYEKVYAEATAYQAQNHKPLSALFVGGGGYTFPRYMAKLYPGSQLDVVEIDPGVTQVAEDMLGLKPAEQNITSYNEDARLFLSKPPTTRYSLIMGDAFNDYSVPYHLTTQEFGQRVRDWLAPDGIYMVNLIDGPRRDFLRAYTYTLQQVFRNVYVVPGIRYWRESPRVTFVLLASDTPIDMDAFKNIDGGDGETLTADMLLSDSEVAKMLSEGRKVALTDQYAPVDNMLAPVFRGEAAPVQPTEVPPPAATSAPSK